MSFTHTINEYIALLAENRLLKNTPNVPDVPVQTLTYDSRAVTQGTLFICKGAHFKEEYLENALAAGAVCYLSETPYAPQDKGILVTDIRRAMALLFDFHYDSVWNKLHIIGITGTKGKSTTTYFLKYILDEYLHAASRPRSAYISSIDTYDGVSTFESHLTTPEVGELYTHFANAAKCGIDYLTMEVSSQALKYDRVYGVGFDTGVYLNIGEDHISAVEHPDFDDYFASKMKLFAHCKNACVSLDTLRVDEVLKASSVCERVLTFSMYDEKADVYAYNLHKVGNDTVFTVRTPLWSQEITLTIPGLFNVQNALAAISVCVLHNIPAHDVYVGLMKARSSGRMEIYTNSDNKAVVIVDYAHNKLSFQSLYDSVLKEFPGRRIVTVFGCPGKKALQRRKDLGELAGKYSDYVYITEEDPGEEPLLEICEQIAVHVAAEKCAYEIEPDRGEAIRKAVFSCTTDSVVLITGKGNETRQKRGTEYIPCRTDVDYATQYLKEFDVANEVDPAEKIRSIQSVLPAFRRLYGKTVVIKLGGSIMESETALQSLYEDIELLSMVGARLVLVHGGGKAISAALKQKGLKPEFLGGYRVTDKETMDVVEEVLSGKVNKALVSGLRGESLNACGISGKDGGLITAHRKQIPEGNIGYVGEVERVDASLVELLLANGYLPVVSPVSLGGNGETLNINADDAAFALAEALGADTLMFLTDVDGILLDVENRATLVHTLSLEKAKELVENSFVEGGMMPKLKNCIRSVENGVNEVAIVNGSVKYDLVSYFITKGKIGTVISK